MKQNNNLEPLKKDDFQSLTQKLNLLSSKVKQQSVVSHEDLKETNEKDSLVQSEEEEYREIGENVKRKDEAITKNLELKNSDYQQNIELRREAFSKIFYLIVCNLIFVSLFIIFALFTKISSFPPEVISEIIKTVLRTTTAQVIALFAIIVHFLFSIPKK